MPRYFFWSFRLLIAVFSFLLCQFEKKLKTRNKTFLQKLKLFQNFCAVARIKNNTQKSFFENVCENTNSETFTTNKLFVKFWIVAFGTNRSSRPDWKQRRWKSLKLALHLSVKKRKAFKMCLGRFNEKLRNSFETPKKCLTCSKSLGNHFFPSGNKKLTFQKIGFCFGKCRIVPKTLKSSLSAQNVLFLVKIEGASIKTNRKKKLHSAERKDGFKKSKIQI